MRSVVDNLPFPPCPAPFNLTDYVLTAGQTTPNKIALIYARPGGDKRYSYAEISRLVLSIATGFLQAGLKPGDRVVLRLGNSLDFPVSFLAMAAVGILPAPVSMGLTIPEVESLAGLIQAKAIVQSKKAAIDISGLQQISTADFEHWHYLPAATPELGDPNRPGYVFFTSGTSGSPKAVLHAHRAVWARRMMWDGWYGLRTKDVLFHAGAMNWTYTLGTGLFDPWAIGATAIVQEESNLTAVPNLLNRHQATIFAAAPAIYRRLLRHNEKMDIPNLRHGLSAGDILPAAIEKAWTNRTSTPIFQAFGLTECSTFLSSAPLGAPPLTAQPGRKIAILDDAGPVKIGKPGRIAIHKSDPGLMLGYLNRDVVDIPLQDDWFRTTDLGQMQKSGCVDFIGRSAEMLNAGGIRVSPKEVESVLQTAPNVEEVAICELEIKPDVFVIAAFVVTQKDFGPAEFEKHALEQLATYKRPRIVQQVDDLPRTANGKLRRADLPKLWRP